MEGLFSVKSDVYSFGILLLEIISGRKNSGLSFPDRSHSLLSYTWKMWTEGSEGELIDEALINACPAHIAMRWIHIALLCVQEDLTDRPTMSSVVLMLGSENVDLPQPSPPPFSTSKHLLSDQSTTSGTKVLTSDQSSTSMSI
uniref:Serine-threonine/tyrosine-protein kinase catalytic domain-containing protein n=1 Tax=Kalanchoe fedtschenkoi TaxID=63787 RepID=A0A7N0U7D4_KALFE